MLTAKEALEHLDFLKSECPQHASKIDQVKDCFINGFCLDKEDDRSDPIDDIFHDMLQDQTEKKVTSSASNLIATQICVKIDDIEYPSIVHAFQAAKVLSSDAPDKVEQQKLIAKSKISVANAMGRSCKIDLQQWEQDKGPIMRNILSLAVEQDDDVKQFLLGTGTETIHEDVMGGEWNTDNGNKLGELWMEVREALKKGSKKKKRARSSGSYEPSSPQYGPCVSET